ncbi:suppressor of fused domain protein [Pseudomonas guariconensis]|uniref:ankyrin repeat domain-containing protein n=1 Tax=Pseudomonas TaxID=286 RepID=UPI001CE40D3C|nr:MULTISPECIES: ankyrin repeat domain-containing protein [Pseudomonas]MCO7639678.1 suppressor of fused domain protein [Pseudomonas sp. S 311-6]MCO7514374.1 suppressor of fused domain protein [Pseudomonas putida]MCO7565180.1 suppressor of fused domain protein [Pseudomonas mosselii]MCO7604427.1 suppressor of fused domain protein [Pseudomonas guariconensis]MCO7616458.1 suppressor of fused domain protein [Pseudomonas guariconensis]
MTDRQRLYEKHETKLDRLYDDIEEGKLERVRTFAQKYPDLLALPRYGEAGEEGLLHMAARAGQTKICGLLLELGLDPNQPFVDEGHGTALAQAASEGHLETCACLLDAGAWVDGLPLSVCPPLYAAAQSGHREVVALLLARGAEVNRLHLRFNDSALDAARAWDHPHTADLLLSHGARSTLEVEADDAEGAGQAIVTFVHNTAGWVLPNVFSPPSEDPRTTLHVSLLDGKSDFKLLFTVGLYQAVPMTELFICLPGDWALPQARLPQHGAWNFPVQLLARLARQTLEHGPLCEGMLIQRSDPGYADLPWPEAVDAMLVVDKLWNEEPAAQAIPKEERVTLLMLAPVKFTSKGAPVAKALATLVERKRTASWKTLALAIPA